MTEKEEPRLVIATIQRNEGTRASSRKIAAVLEVPARYGLPANITYDEQCQSAKAKLQKHLFRDDKISHIALFPTSLVVWL